LFRRNSRKRRAIVGWRFLREIIGFYAVRPLDEGGRVCRTGRSCPSFLGGPPRSIVEKRSESAVLQLARRLLQLLRIITE